MLSSHARPLGVGVALALLAAPAMAGAVRVLTPAGGLLFSDIQPAVDAAVEGDVLLVAEGSYGGFTIDGKSLTVVAVPGSDVQLPGVVVRNLSAGQTTLLVGLRAAAVTYEGGGVLVVEDNQGFVRLQDCDFLGADIGWGVECLPWHGGDGVRVLDSERVVLIDCRLRGTTGQAQDMFNSSCDAGEGGAGLLGERSSIALFGCEVIGGEGGGAKYSQGTGGAGLDSTDCEVFASGGFFAGGRGGEDFYRGPYAYGPGGDGAQVDGASLLGLLDCDLIGGEGSPPGTTITGTGTLETYPTVARTLTLATIAAGGSWLEVSYQGEVGDRLSLILSRTVGQRFERALWGVRLTGFPSPIVKVPLAVAPASGSLTVSVPPAALHPGELHRPLVTQGLVGAPWGMQLLTSGRHTLVLSRKLGPDCDGNGVSDYLDIALGTTPDQNHNLIPDVCEPSERGGDEQGSLRGAQPRPAQRVTPDP